MNRRIFEGQVSDLRVAIIGTVERHFEERCLAFDVNKFLEECGINLDQATRNAYFVGAEIFPVD